MRNICINSNFLFHGEIYTEIKCEIILVQWSNTSLFCDSVKQMWFNLKFQKLLIQTHSQIRKILSWSLLEGVPGTFLSWSLRFIQQTLLCFQILLLSLRASPLNLTWPLRFNYSAAILFIPPVLFGFPSDSAVKNLPAVHETEETWVRSLGRENPLE